MGNFLARLLGGVLFAVLLIGSVHAETIPATNGDYEPTVTLWQNPFGMTDAFRSTPQDTCEATATSYIGAHSAVSVSKITKIKYSCSAVRTANGQTYDMGPLNAKTPFCNGSDGYNATSEMCVGYTCPTGQNWTLNGSTCSRPDCPAGETRQSDGTCSAPCPGRQVKRDGQCACDPNQLPGRPVGGEWPWMKLTGASSPSKVCDDYCERNTGFGLGGGGTWHVEVTTWTGAKCNGTSANTEAPTPNKPPPCAAAEGVMTSSSGSVRCVPEGTPGASTPSVGTTTSTVTHPDGSTTTTTTTTTRDPTTGVTTTSSTTTNNPGPGGGTQSGQPGTTTTTTDASGNGGGNGNGDGEDDGSDFCAKHPDSIVCKNNTFSGSCNEGESAPTCEGDAALCATAKAAFELKCGSLGKKGTEYGQKLIEGQDDKAGELPDPKNPENHNVGSLNYSDGGGACPPDLVFHVMGRSTTISMTEVCTIGGWLGNIGVALSLLIGGFIVIGAIRS